MVWVLEISEPSQPTAKHRRLPDQQWIQIYVGLIVFSVFGLIFTRVTGFEAGLIASATAAAVLILGSWIVARAIGPVAAVAIALLGGASELLGVFTGLPFGPYVYSTAWWPTVLLGPKVNFPLLVPLAWLLVVGGAYGFVGRRFPTPFLRVVGTATLATLIDATMEPVMTHSLGFWRWIDLGRPWGALPGGASPILNSVGWWLVSGIAVATVEALRRKREPASLSSGIVISAYLALMVIIGGGEPLQPLMVSIVFGFGCLIVLDLPPKKTRPKAE